MSTTNPENKPDNSLQERAESAERNFAIVVESLRKAVDFAEWGWTIIANAHGGNWELESKDWQQAAAKYRDKFHDEIRHLLPSSTLAGEATGQRTRDFCDPKEQQLGID